MTLLVTSMILPNSAGTPALTAAGALSLLIPDFIHYVIAFFILAGFWTAHHIQFNQIRFITRPFLTLNIIALFFVTLVPFTTSFVGDYPDTLAAIIFELNLMMLGIMMFVQWYYAAHNYRLISPRYPASKVQEGLFRNLVIPLVSLAGVSLLLRVFREVRLSTSCPRLPYMQFPAILQETKAVEKGIKILKKGISDSRSTKAPVPRCVCSHCRYRQLSSCY